MTRAGSASKHRITLLATLLATLLLLLAAAAVWLNLRGNDASGAPRAAATDTATIARGAYLARAGNCQHCHTSSGAAAYSGGRSIPTPFGTLYSRNLTPDASSGLGGWSPAQFRRALHQGRSRDGGLLYPACPYDAFTRVSDEDADALFAHLQSLPPVAQPNRPHALSFPFGTQAALAVWRALYFRPGRFEPAPRQTAEWNRGAYLVQGLGHCAACHAERNLMGAMREPEALRGGLIPQQNWFAPALGGDSMPVEQQVELLQVGRSHGAATLGPMAEVVLHSTQHLSEADLEAMAVHMRSLPPPDVATPRAEPLPAAVREQGARLYEAHCASCHGADGRGVGGFFAPLADNPAVTLDPPVNVVQVLLGGAFAPSTAGNPRPFGMPPFANTLNDENIAAVASYIRNAWGNQAPAVRPQDVNRWRGSVRP